MLDAILEFLTLYLVVVTILFFVGWRRGWFLETAVDDRRARVERMRKATSDKAVADRRQSRQRPAPSVRAMRVGQQLSNTDESVPPARSTAGWPSRSRGNDDFPVHPAVAAASRKAGINAAKLEHPDHWAIDTIKARPGWLLFEAEDFLGEPALFAKYTVPGSRRAGEIPMYRISAVREIETGDNIVAASRRKIIETRWRQRNESRGTVKASGSSRSDTRSSVSPAKSEAGAGARRSRVQ